MQSVGNFDMVVPETVAKQHSICVEDKHDANMLDHLVGAVEFIDDAIGLNTKVLSLLLPAYLVLGLRNTLYVYASLMWRAFVHTAFLTCMKS